MSSTFILYVTTIMLAMGSTNPTSVSSETSFLTLEQCEQAKYEVISEPFVPALGSADKLETVYSANRAVCVERVGAAE